MGQNNKMTNTENKSASLEWLYNYSVPPTFNLQNPTSSPPTTSGCSPSSSWGRTPWSMTAARRCIPAWRESARTTSAGDFSWKTPGPRSWRPGSTAHVPERSPSTTTSCRAPSTCRSRTSSMASSLPMCEWPSAFTEVLLLPFCVTLKFPSTLFHTFIYFAVYSRAFADKKFFHFIIFYLMFYSKKISSMWFFFQNFLICFLFFFFLLLFQKSDFFPRTLVCLYCKPSLSRMINAQVIINLLVLLYYFAVSSLHYSLTFTQMSVFSILIIFLGGNTKL